MPSTRRPLIARLRRRLATCAWLFAFLVLAKGVYAMACVADGVPVVVAASSVAEATTHAPSIADDANAPCWHDGSGGCHCACAHATALPPTGALMHAAIAPTVPTVFVAPRRTAPTPHSDLRPPIA